MKKYRKWTEIQETAIRAGAGRLTSRQIAAELALPVDDVSKKAYRMRVALLPCYAPPFHWTEDRVAELRRAEPEGLTSLDVATKLGCSRGTVAQKAYIIGIKLALCPGCVAWWFDDRVSTLRAGIAAHKSLEEIAGELGTTVGAVRQKANLLKLGHKPPAQLAWDARLDQFRDVLRELLSTREMGDKLGITKNAVVGMINRMFDDPAVVTWRKARSHLNNMDQRSEVVRPERDGRHWPERGECYWPSGDPGEPGFHFCLAATTGEYCDEHAAIAHRRPSKSEHRSVDPSYLPRSEREALRL